MLVQSFMGNAVESNFLNGDCQAAGSVTVGIGINIFVGVNQ